jgi:F0F1-type ATP synthase delta subunit
MMTPKKKTFDAVAESRKCREETGALLATMTRAERIAFLNRRIANFPKARSKAQHREPAAPPAFP